MITSKRVWGALVGLLILAAGVLVYVAATRDPEWFTRTPANGAAEADTARALEQGCASQISLVRGVGEVKWRLLMRASDINAWLAVRLPQWLQYDRSLPWPEGVTAPQVWMDAAGVHGAALKDGWVIGTTWEIQAPAQEGGVAMLVPSQMRVGKLVLPFGSGISELFVPELAKPFPLEAKLGDGRSVRVTGAEFVDGQVVLDLVTVSPVRQ